MLTTRVYLVRHGATQLTAEDRFSGAVGITLSEEGRLASGSAGRTPAARGYLSDLLQPARAYFGHRAHHLRVPQHTDRNPRRSPRDQSRPLGRPDARRGRNALPRRIAAWEEDPFTFAPEAGESGVAVLARALPVIREVVARHPGECVLVVSHKATIRLLISSLLGFDARGYRDRLDQAPGLRQRARLSRSGARASHVVQRYVALCTAAAPVGAQSVALVG